MDCVLRTLSKKKKRRRVVQPNTCLKMESDQTLMRKIMFDILSQFTHLQFGVIADD